MSSTAAGSPTDSGNKVMARIVDLGRGYVAWLALHAASMMGKEPAIDGEADASWRAR